ncbi:hypothetical protein AU195_19420 [Mycobacterium sp. IS-1496]|uniref:DUF6498-containing protein n=1 Tax=Mycobacterium sp. IS-1496 TaxID=1772284 RepID=UPI0007417446|nr:DUF6498-containing protein [Mycobacterium sp. IS-1496]KUI34311.1 hypothetical protein AU195_19420 [Mycobacterium sp. IS-1496]
MIRFVHLLTLLGLVAVPAAGWFAADWSGGTTLAVYWVENVATCVFVSLRILAHQTWSPRRGHFRYTAPSADRRTARGSFLSGFVVTGFAFCAAHGVFLGVILFLLDRNGKSGFAEIDWRSVGVGCAGVVILLAVDFLVDLPGLRRLPFHQLEQTANQGVGRVIVVHLTLIFGMVGVAVTGAPSTFFGVFIVLKTLFAISTALPQWEPEAAPTWFSRLMNRLPNVHPGRTFEEFWAADRAAERARREQNERPWSGGRRG